MPRSFVYHGCRVFNCGMELYSVSYTYGAVSSGQYTEAFTFCEFNIEEKIPVNIRKKLPRKG